MTDADCPTEDELRRVAFSPESTTLDGPLVAHLDRCDRCRSRLEGLTGDPGIADATWSELASPPPSSANLIATIDQLSSRAVAAELRGSTRFGDLDRWVTPSTARDPPRLDGYVLLECVGRGGMGVVFRALDPTHGRVVALKAMAPDLAQDDRARALFLREARAIAAVRHPNVVALHAVSEVDGLPYLTMDFVEGESLEARLRGGAVTPPAEIVQIGAAVAAGLAACHEQGVIHRDIKPSNVLLSSSDGSVKITDFGLAAVASTPTLTQNGFLSGTPDYVAPERLAIGSEADERSDLFSLGCLLYTMATGEEPFGGETPLITLHRIATEKPAALRQKNPSIPANLARTIASLMAKRPQDRPESAEQARAMLLGEQTRRRRGQSIAGSRNMLYAIALLGALLSVYGWSQSRDGKAGTQRVTNADALLDAIRSTPDGGTIEVDTDETLAIRPCEIISKSISIVAAEGKNPGLELLIERGDRPPDFLFRVANGGLRLVGLHLRDDLAGGRYSDLAPEELLELEAYGLLTVEQSVVSADRCRFSTRSHGCCLELASAANVELKDCFLVAPSGTAVNWAAAHGDRLVLEGCASASVAAIMVVARGDADLTWKRSTALTEIAVIEMTHATGTLSANVADCVIQSRGSLVMTSLHPPSEPAFKRLLRWRGSRNRIRGEAVQFVEDERTPDWAQAVSRWAEADNGSVYGATLFRLSHGAVVERIARGESVEAL
ncbi:MAG: serine/threonine-protein kinase [Planctomycetota bacterium]